MMETDFFFEGWDSCTSLIQGFFLHSLDHNYGQNTFKIIDQSYNSASS